LVAGATGLFAVATLSLAYVQHLVLLSAAMMAGGVAWMALVSTFNVAVQTAVPAWVHARALAVYTLVFQGGMAAGSVVWGVIATHLGIPIALLGAALGLLVGLLAMGRYRLQSAEGVDLAPSLHVHEPVETAKFRGVPLKRTVWRHTLCA
jgi:MFS family permease